MTTQRPIGPILTVCAMLAGVGGCQDQPSAREEPPRSEGPTLQQAFDQARAQGQLDVHSGAHADDHVHGAEAPRAGYDSSDVRADIRDAVVAQLYFRSTHGRYAANLSDLGFRPRLGVTMEIIGRDSTGASFLAWSAEPDEECALVYGEIMSPRPYVLQARKIYCKSVG